MQGTIQFSSDFYPLLSCLLNKISQTRLKNVSLPVSYDKSMRHIEQGQKQQKMFRLWKKNI